MSIWIGEIGHTVPPVTLGGRVYDLEGRRSCAVQRSLEVIHEQVQFATRYTSSVLRMLQDRCDDACDPGSGHQAELTTSKIELGHTRYVECRLLPKQCTVHGTAVFLITHVEDEFDKHVEIGSEG